MDTRILEQARILVDHSTRVKPKDMVLIRYTDNGLDLVKAVYAEVAKRGANSFIMQVPTEALRSFYDLTPEENLTTVPANELAAFLASDVVISLRGEENLRAMSSIDKKKIATRANAAEPVLTAYMKRRWVLTQVPSHAYAQEAGMSLREYEDFIYEAMLSDPKADETRLRAIEKLMDETSQVTIRSEDTDLTFSIKGRKAISDLGEHNVPWSEVFTAPVENSTEGHVSFDLPAIYAGSEASDIRLEFSKGEVVDYKASKGEDLLKAMIETDDKTTRGSRKLGEFGAGTNYGITKFTRNMLFDEKMAGTIHLALGRSYPDCRGANYSALHWDILKTMTNGEILFDNKVAMRGGKLVIPPEERQGGHGEV